MRRLRPVASLLVLVTLVAGGCSGNDGDEAAGTTETTAATAETAETTEVTTTASEVKTAIFERSYTECGSFSLVRLASKYKVPRSPATVASAVARDWTQRFDGGEDAVQAGRDGCLQAMRESR